MNKDLQQFIGASPFHISNGGTSDLEQQLVCKASTISGAIRYIGAREGEATGALINNERSGLKAILDLVAGAVEHNARMVSEAAYNESKNASVRGLQLVSGGEK